jgi:arylsulfatase
MSAKSGKISRRDFLKKTAAAAAATIPGLSAACGRGKAPAVKTTGKPPSVIFLVTDQQRADALGAAGNRDIITPNLDRLAREGVHFTNCWSTSTLCIPSRMSTFSGLYTYQHGTMYNVWDALLSKHEGTLLDPFLKRDYRIAWLGKNHTYQPAIFEQLDLYNHQAREKSRGTYPINCNPWWHGELFEAERDSNAGIITEGAIEFIREHRDEPFFVNVNYFDPHPPYFCPKKYAELYASARLGLHADPPQEQLDPRFLRFRSAFGLDRLPDEELKKTMRYYYGAVSFVDFQVGRILDELDRLGLAGNTIVVFMSDHGDFMGEFHMVRKAIFLYDALLRVPLIIRSPFRGNHAESDPVQTIDLLPAIYETFGEKVPEHLPGNSFLPYLKGAKNIRPQRHVFASASFGDTDLSPVDRANVDPDWADEPDWRVKQADLLHFCDSETVMVATPEWKFIRNRGVYNRDELYARGPGKGDFNNLIDEEQYRQVAESLSAELEKFRPIQG